jgi:hypothetical protein
MPTQDHAYVHDFAIQLFPIWIAVPILIAVVFGLWKLAKIIWAAISN